MRYIGNAELPLGKNTSITAWHIPTFHPVLKQGSESIIVLTMIKMKSGRELGNIKVFFCSFRN